jgi:branched-subunit amino acid aminotransferase/4-amino-4-deoxychorismate lyase
VESGLLPGILRQSLIEAGQAGEQILILDDLRRASAWFLGSSLRGLRRAVLMEAAAAL